MHGGFINLRSSLPMNLKVRPDGLQGLGRSQVRHRADHGDMAGMPGAPRWAVAVRRSPSLADAMYAPVCTRLSPMVLRFRRSAAYRDHVMNWPLMVEWIEGARAEPEEIEELDMEF